jgi:ATP dependent DNA ligase domain
VSRFVPPALPVLKKTPPAGDAWQYELKFDGYRIQLHKVGQTAALYGKNGGDFSKRFPTIAAAVLALPVRSCIIDGELIAAGRERRTRFPRIAALAACARMRLPTRPRQHGQLLPETGLERLSGRLHPQPGISASCRDARHKGLPSPSCGVPISIALARAASVSSSSRPSRS